MFQLCFIFVCGPKANPNGCICPLLSLGWSGLSTFVGGSWLFFSHFPLQQFWMLDLVIFFLTSRCNNSGCWTWSFFSHSPLQQCWMRNFDSASIWPCSEAHSLYTAGSAHRPCLQRYRPLAMGTLSISVMPMACPI